jgi:hypothetical protein
VYRVCGEGLYAWKGQNLLFLLNFLLLLICCLFLGYGGLFRYDVGSLGLVGFGRLDFLLLLKECCNDGIRFGCFGGFIGCILGLGGFLGDLVLGFCCIVLNILLNCILIIHLLFGRIRFLFRHILFFFIFLFLVVFLIKYKY